MVPSRVAAVLGAYSHLLAQRTFHDQPSAQPVQVCGDVLDRYPWVADQLCRRFVDRFSPLAEIASGGNHLVEGLADVGQRSGQYRSQSWALNRSVQPEGLSDTSPGSLVPQSSGALTALYPQGFHDLPSQVQTWAQQIQDLIDQTVRTNAFISGAETIALKFCHPDGVIEIFVDHPGCAGVLVKQGLVARGGVRWSLRPDFRAEALALMRTQVLKNALVVPWGGKGTFFVKSPQTLTGLQAYKLFMGAILDLADQRHQGQVTYPSHMRVYDGPDPYFVVAPDRGTAAFSDEANALAVQRGYWLGDAFASGGSSGYNHKDLAITARGVWTGVLHQRALARIWGSGPGSRVWRERPVGLSARYGGQGSGLEGSARDAHASPSQQDGPLEVLRIAGVGDLRGDLFGNGMTTRYVPRAPGILLVAAFNHEAIFIDPVPDLDASAQERRRLFSTPHCRWQDYTAFGPGGAVYDRSAPLLTLTREAIALLGLPDQPVCPDGVIKAILGLTVDVLWMGGIGTFIAPLDQEPLEDAANASIRIRPEAVGASLVAEGANLSLTQPARVQLARRGVSLNTDGVDNAGGVACSDLEVMLKIFLRLLRDRQLISAQDPVKLLGQCQDQVCQQVLVQLASQHVSISATLAMDPGQALGQGMATLDWLLVEGLSAPWLPKQELEDMHQRWSRKERVQEQESSGRRPNQAGGEPADHSPLDQGPWGPLRPDLALLMGCVKLVLRSRIQSLPANVWQEGPLAEVRLQALRDYVPDPLAQWAGQMDHHPLAQPLATTVLANVLVDTLGPLVWGGIQRTSHLSWDEILEKVLGLAYRRQWAATVRRWAQQAVSGDLVGSCLQACLGSFAALRKEVFSQLAEQGDNPANHDLHHDVGGAAD